MELMLGIAERRGESSRYRVEHDGIDSTELLEEHDCDESFQRSRNSFIFRLEDLLDRQRRCFSRQRVIRAGRRRIADEGCAFFVL
jgi:hypothetical protein